MTEEQNTNPLDKLLLRINGRQCTTCHGETVYRKSKKNIAEGG